MESGGCVPSGGAEVDLPLVGLGAKPPRSWSISAFCVMAKAKWTKCKKIVHNVQLGESEIMHAKSSKPPRMFQWNVL